MRIENNILIAAVAINIYDDRIETTLPGGITDGFDPIRLEPEKSTSKSSREFFYTTIPNVNYGMADADFEKLTRKIHPENDSITNRKKIGKTAQTTVAIGKFCSRSNRRSQ